jgi:hypothetical protein
VTGGFARIHSSNLESSTTVRHYTDMDLPVVRFNDPFHDMHPVPGACLGRRVADLEHPIMVLTRVFVAHRLQASRGDIQWVPRVMGDGAGVLIVRVAW